MFSKIIKIILYSLLIYLISSCSSYKYEKRDYWLRHQYRALNYIDTTNLDSKTTSYIIDGSIAKTKGDFSGAIVNYMLALKYDTTAAILYAISDCFLFLEKYGLSIEYAHLALNKDANFLPCYELLCKSYLYLNDIKNATIALESYIQINENEEMLYYLGNLYEFQKSELAQTTYQKLISKYKNSDAIEHLVNIYRADSNYARAEEVLYDVWKREPNNFKYIIELINNWLIENKIDSIMNNVNNFDSNLAVEELETMYNYILTNMDTNNISKNNYNIIINKIDSRFDFSQLINISAGNLALKNGDTTRTKLFFNKILNNANAQYEIILKCVNSYYNNGYFALAKNTLNICIGKHPNEWIYPYWRGILEEEENNYDSSLKYLIFAKQIDSSNIRIDRALAGLYFNMKEYNLSDSIYEKIMVQEPNNPTICNNYAYSLSIRGVNLDKALTLCQRALEYSPTSSEYLDTYGWIHYKMGNYEKAINYLEESLEYDDKNYEVYQHLADIYLILNNNLSALKVIENAIQVEPNNSELIKKKIEIENLINKK
jgi:tetratricopeptide (TPR) repeat protein